MWSRLPKRNTASTAERNQHNVECERAGLRDTLSSLDEVLSPERIGTSLFKQTRVFGLDAVNAIRKGPRKTKSDALAYLIALGGNALAIGTAVDGAMLTKGNYNVSRKDRNQAFYEVARIYLYGTERSRSLASRGTKV